mgnify:CR=1 FL=1
MDVTIHRNRCVAQVGDLFSTASNKLYALIYDEGEKYPYHLLSFQTFTIVESYDALPTKEEIEEDIDEEITGIYDHRDSHIHIH